jgi:aminoglycoside phosphotransferase (APT) family kinase protein
MKSITDSQIKQFFNKKFHVKPEKITDKTIGYDQIVKIVIAGKKKYVLKIPKREKEMIKDQVFASKKWSALGLPVPKGLFYSRDVLVESFVEGVPLDKCKLSEKQKEKVYFALGRMMRKMHSVRTKGFGNFGGGTRGVFASRKEYEKWIFGKIKVSLNLIKEKKLLSEKEIDLVEDYVKSKVKLPSKVGCVLTHQDLCEEHVFVKDGKISGIIDLADIKSDDPMSDFRRIAKENKDRKYLQYVVKGYGKVAMERIKMHKFLLSVYNLPKLYRNKKEKRLMFFIGILMEIARK